jgi:hypothetical protein
MPKIAIGYGRTSADKLIAEIKLDQLAKMRAVAEPGDHVS